MKLKGVIIPVAVPLGHTGEPDLASLRRLVSFLLDAGAHALFANGSMGAFALLTDSQQANVIETVADAANGQVPVLAGVSDTGPARVAEKIRRHQRLGMDALVALPPFFFPCGQEELLAFYRDAAEIAEKPLVLYDNPRLARNAMSAETIARLASHPNVCGAKLSAADPLQWQDILQSEIDRTRFSLICGAGKLTSLALRLGFDGITEGLHNVIPDLAVNLFGAAAAQDWEAADRIQARINRCFEIFEIAGGWRGLDVALRELGLASRAAPSPYDRALDAATRERIRNVLEKECVIPSSSAR
jgi:4-hydroxy-tetrahydrodipicolinate synthase